MANTYSPFGLRSFGRLEGGAPTAGLTRVFIASSDATAIFNGDPVVNSSIGTGGNYVTAATGSSYPVRGIFQGCEYYNVSVNRITQSPYFPGSITSTADVVGYIIGDTQQLFIAQASTNVSITSSYIGLNIGFTSSVSSAGNTTTGISNVGLTSSNITSSNLLPFNIVDYYGNSCPPGVNGGDITTAGQILIVRPNNWTGMSLTARSS